MDITREQVEKMWKGRWITVSNTTGETWSKCSECQKELDGLEDAYNFCPRCGAPMTDKAVDILWKRLEAFNTAVGKEQEPVIDEKIKTAIRAGAFAIINSKYKNQIFWDDTHGYYGGPYRMGFSEAVTILLEFIGHPPLSKDQ